MSEGFVVFEVFLVGKGVGMESGWGSLFFFGIFVNVIFLKFVVREISNSIFVFFLNIFLSCVLVYSEKNIILFVYLLDLVNGIFCGGFGSGGLWYLYGFVFNRYCCWN